MSSRMRFFVLVLLWVIVCAVWFSPLAEAGGPSLNPGPEKAPGPVIVYDQADSIHIARNGSVICRVYGPWKQGRVRVLYFETWWDRVAAVEGSEYSDSTLAFESWGEGDLLIAFQDPQIPRLAPSTWDSKARRGGYRYEFLIFYGKKRQVIPGGLLERGASGRLRFSKAGYSK